METHKIGTFEVDSSVMVVSDPCYSIGTWMTEEIWGVKPGTWHASIETEDTGDIFGVRIWKLHAVHSDYIDKVDGLREINHGEFGVDSGQAGIFDYKHYQDNNDAAGMSYEHFVGKPWYDLCCTLTMRTEHDVGVLPHGVVSCSGLGDGLYEFKCFAPTDGPDKDKTVAITLDYKLDEFGELVPKLVHIND